MKIGRVKKVVIDPNNRLVTAILANAVLPEPDEMGLNWQWNAHQYSERSILIPIEMVRHLTSTSVFLKEEVALVAAFKNFDPGLYFPAPEVWEPPYPYKNTDILLPKQAETA